MTAHRYAQANSEKKFIAIAGNIGAGKSTLVELLAKRYQWQPVLESTDATPDLQNPYLADFYADMSRWAFHLQMFFLTTRFKQHRAIQRGARSAIQDRTIYEDAEIFAQNLFEMNLLTQRDRQTYRLLYEEMISLLAPPDLLVYLHASVPRLVANIERRSRGYESKVQIDYLQRLQTRYDTWYGGYSLGKKIMINVDGLDFVDNPSDFNVISERIERELFGLFAGEE
jgi:deoxyadenosine/deoxycytidine kinase